MRKDWIAVCLGVLVLGAVPGVSSAQYSGGEYSPFNYLNSGSYSQQHYLSAYSEPPRASYNRPWLPGYADYSPYSSARYAGYSQPYYRDVQPASVLTPSSARMSGEEQEEPPQEFARVSIRVRVPANAELWFEDSKTSQTGGERDFLSPPLETGRTFTYRVRARWTDADGAMIDRTMKVVVRAGRRSALDFVNPARNRAE
jgi:uncharacterized protein (TIGR03000 family)